MNGTKTRPWKRAVQFVLPAICWSYSVAVSQTIIINEVSNGPTGNQEYVEFVVADNNLTYNCTSTAPPCIDLRGWIFDDNSGYHGNGGIAAGAMRFSNNAIWACVPIGTIIVIYNGLDPNVDMPPDDVSLSDGNCRIIAPASNTALFEGNIATPGAVSCSYPATGWVAGGDWTFTFLANSGDCARIVDLSGCEVFSVCWASCSTNSPIYFESLASGSQNVWFFNDGNPNAQINWSEGSASAGGEQTPGAPNNAANAAYIAQFSNNCSPITPIQISNVSSTDTDCGCVGTASVSAFGSIPGYTFQWSNAAFLPIGQNTNAATNLCAGTYNCIATSAIGCTDTATVTILAVGGATTTTQNVQVCANTSITYPDGVTVTIVGPSSHTSTLVAVSGCDSIIITTVTLSPAFSATVPVSLCTGSGYVYPDGTTVSNLQTNQSHVSNLIGPSGCDSIITTTITVANAITYTQTIDLCIGENYTYPNGTQLTNATVNQSYTSNFTTSTGCDSLVVTNVVVHPLSTSIVDVALCESALGPYTFPDGSTVVLTGNLTQVSQLSSVWGCDSIITTSISVSPSYSSTENVELCSGSSYVFPDGSSVSNIIAPQTQVSLLSSVSGCDSTINTDITITSILQNTLDIPICLGADYTYLDGLVAQSVLSNESHTTTFISVQGCDSLVSENLLVLPLNVTNQSVAACENSTVTYPDGTTEVITADASHTSTFISAQGCDSLIITSVVMDTPIATAVQVAMCEGSAYVFPDGSAITVTANLVQVSNLQASSGCDSTITTSVTMLAQYDTTVVVALCIGDDFAFPDGEVLSNIQADTSHVSLLNSISGCDSMVQTILTLVNTPVAFFTSTADSVDVQFAPEIQFLDASTNALLTEWVIYDSQNEELYSFLDTSAVDSVFSYTFPEGSLGVYTICLTATSRSGCSETYCDSIPFELHIGVYIPNAFTPDLDGTNEVFRPMLSGVALVSYELLIFNRWGQRIFESYSYEKGWDGTYSENPAQIEVYTYQLTFSGAHSNRIYTYSGRINLLR